MTSNWPVVGLVFLLSHLVCEEEASVPYWAGSGSGTAQQSLRGRHVKIVSETWMPWFNVSAPSPDPSTWRYAGIMVQVLGYLQLSLNFTYTMSRPPDGKWGVCSENGTCNGMIGVLQRKEADFAIGPFGVNYERAQAADFSYPVLVDYITTVVPVELGKDPWPIVRPYQWPVWVGVLLSPPLFIAAMAAADYAFDRGARPPSWASLTGFTLRTCLVESAPWVPDERIYQRVFGIAWMWAYFVIAQGFAGTLTAILTSPVVPLPVNSIADLVAQSQFGWYLEDGAMVVQFFKAGKPGSTERKVYDGATVVPSSCYGMMAEMKRRKFGQVCERSTINSILSDDFSATGSCNFWMTQNDFATVTLAMAFQKKSPYIGEVNSKLQLMNQMGFLKTWIGASMPNASKCRTASDVGASHINKKEVSLSLAETEGLFIVGLMGCVLATLGLISEFTFFGSVKIKRWIQKGRSKLSNMAPAVVTRQLTANAAAARTRANTLVESSMKRIS